VFLSLSFRTVRAPRLVWCLVAAAWLSASIPAGWSAPWRAVGGPVTVTLEPIPTAAAAKAPVPVKVRIENGSAQRLAGTVQVGGPTADVYCEGESSRPFVVASGETAEIVFDVALLPGAAAGAYPIHAFAEFLEGAEGVLKVARTMEAAFPDLPRGTEMAPEDDRVARLPPTSFPTGLDGVLEQWRLEALEDYIRDSDEAVEGGLFSLAAGGEPGAPPVRVAVLPGEQGLLDAWWLFAGPDGAFRLRGLQLGLRVPGSGPGDQEDMVVEVARPVAGGPEDELAWEHFVSCGEWTTLVTVRVGVAPGGQALRLRVESPDLIAELGPGGAAVPVGGVADGADELYREGVPPPRRGGDRVWRYRETGWNLRETGVRDPDGRGWTLTLEPNQSPSGELKVVGGETQGPPEDAAPSGAAVRRKELAGRLWIDAGPARFEDLRVCLEDLQRYGPGPMGLLLGGMRRPGGPGEIWPPDAELGGVEALRKLSEAARSAGALLGPDLALDRIWPLAGTFDFGEVAFGPDGRPRSVPGSGGAYQTRAGAAARRLAEFPALSGARVLVLGSVSGEGELDRSGLWQGPEAVAMSWQKVAGLARQAAGEETILFLRGDGRFGALGADGLLAGPRMLPESDSGQFPFPWPRPDVEGAIPLRPLAEAGPRGDWLAVLHGDGVRVRDTDRVREWVRAAWFVLPLTGAGTETRTVATVGADPRHLKIRRGGLGLLTNGTPQTWEHEGRLLAPWGFHVEGDDLSGGREIRNGIVCEWLERDGGALRYVLAEGAREAELPVFLGAEIALAEPGAVALQTRWRARGGCPYGTRPVAVIHPVDDPWDVQAVVPLEARQPAHRWTGEVTASGTWQPGDLPLGDYAVRMVFLASSGRPLPLAGPRPGTVDAAGPFAAGATPAGVLVVHRAAEGIVEELDFRPDDLPAPGPDAEPGPAPAPVDVGWALTDGGFRWERTAEGMRVTPLPDSLSFGITLRPTALGVAREAIQGWKRVPFQSPVGSPEPPAQGEEPVPLPWDGDELRWTHDPAVLAYEFRVASGDDSDGRGCGPEEPK